MRITGGAWRGREITAPKSDKTRPLTDRGRMGLFNALGDVEGLNLLDAYAGSGAVGLEALSRGASNVTGIEKFHAIARNLNNNVQKLECQAKYTLATKSVEQWARANPGEHGKFDVVFAGPPFDQLDVAALNSLVPYLKQGGVMVVEHYKKVPVSQLNGVDHLDNRQFGESVLSFYRKP